MRSRSAERFAGISFDWFATALSSSDQVLTSRTITGAGWGGATVHLVPESSSTSFIAAIKAGYFAKRFPNLTEAELNDVCFATKPERGACLFENSK